MKQFITSLQLLCLLLLTTACYQEIDIQDNDAESGRQLLTLNAIITPDSLIAAAATSTYYFSEKHNERNFVDDLKISLRINQQDKGFLVFNPHTKLYTADIKPKSGDIVTLQTIYKNKKVSATDTVPPPVQIENIKTNITGPVSIYTGNDYIITYNIDFKDDETKENYYFLSYDAISREYRPLMGERDYTKAYVFKKLADDVNKFIPGWEAYAPDGLPFSDNGINGEAHTIVVREIVQGDSRQLRFPLLQRQFKLFALSKSYYRYLFSILCNTGESGTLHGGIIDLGVVEPSKIYSNINGGVGIFAAYSVSTAYIDHKIDDLISQKP